AGIGVLAARRGVDATAPRARPVAWEARPAPPSAELLLDEGARRIRATIDVGRAVRRVLADPLGGASRVGTAGGSLWRLLRTGMSAAPEVCFNRPIGPHWGGTWLHFDLATVKAGARRLRGPVNDGRVTPGKAAHGAGRRSAV